MSSPQEDITEIANPTSIATDFNTQTPNTNNTAKAPNDDTPGTIDEEALLLLIATCMKEDAPPSIRKLWYQHQFDGGNSLYDGHDNNNKHHKDIVDQIIEQQEALYRVLSVCDGNIELFFSLACSLLEVDHLPAEGLVALRVIFSTSNSIERQMVEHWSQILKAAKSSKSPNTISHLAKSLETMIVSKIQNEDKKKYHFMNIWKEIAPQNTAPLWARESFEDLVMWAQCINRRGTNIDCSQACTISLMLYMGHLEQEMYYWWDPENSSASQILPYFKTRQKWYGNSDASIARCIISNFISVGQNKSPKFTEIFAAVIEEVTHKEAKESSLFTLNAQPLPTITRILDVIAARCGWTSYGSHPTDVDVGSAPHGIFPFSTSKKKKNTKNRNPQ